MSQDINFVEVVNTATGEKQLVPPHYLDNPVLMRGLELPPKARAAAANTAKPPAPAQDAEK